mmetsp:Transcript_46270/g.148563  ORF Transcript_46270/g.148563 Transcript_46270/m.148563 type:complete len:197 (+) Transcript_46270:149-739(+)
MRLKEALAAPAAWRRLKRQACIRSLRSGPLSLLFAPGARSSFWVLSRPGGGCADLQKRAEQNGAHFQANYFVLFLVLLPSCSLLLGRPAWVLGSGLLIAYGALLLQHRLGTASSGRGLEEEVAWWSPKALTNWEGSSRSRQLRLMLGSLLFGYLAFGTGFVLLASCLMALFACHAALHPGACTVGDFISIDEEDDL